MTGKEYNYNEPPKGFYYDNQLESKLLSVSLHPNTKWNGTEWVAFQGDQETEDKEDQLKDEKNECNYPYSKEPICKSVINEDFQVSIANRFTDFGNDAIGSFWNSQDVKALAPYAKEIGGNLVTLAQKTAEWLGKNTSGSIKVLGNDVKFGDMANKIAAEAPKFVNSGVDYLSRALVVQGTRFSYYGGTGIDFSNLAMKFTLFSDWINGAFCTVEDQVSKILPYVIGDFVALLDAKIEVSPDVKEFVNRFASWQMPPGGFQSDLNSIDTVQKGTLKLRIGTRYALENLVISSAQFNFSKTMVKTPDKELAKEPMKYSVPQYCEIILNLRPASQYSKNSLERFISGRAVAGTLKIYEDKVKTSLGDLEKKIKDEFKLSEEEKKKIYYV